MNEEPKKEFAKQADHDFFDIVELPDFVNMPSDQGMIANVEEANSLEDGIDEQELSIPKMAATNDLHKVTEESKVSFLRVIEQAFQVVLQSAIKNIH